MCYNIFMRYGRVDNNQSQIITTLRTIPGLSVANTSQLGDGFPDMVVGYEGFDFLFEIKDTGKRRDLTPKEIDFQHKWTGHYDVIESADEVLEIIGFDNLLSEEQLMELENFRSGM